MDEWFHERGFGWVRAEGKPASVTPWWGHLVKPLCDLREKRLMGKDEWAAQQANRTSANNVSTLINWTFRHAHKGRRDA